MRIIMLLAAIVMSILIVTIPEIEWFMPCILWFSGFVLGYSFSV